MTARIFQLPIARPHHQGTVHVMPAQGGGFEVGHESGSGDSWGSFEHHPTAEAAITAAHLLNRDQYGGSCQIAIWDAVRASLPDAGAATPEGEF